MAIQDAAQNDVSGPEAQKPERMCVGCRGQAPKDELERFIYHDDVGVVFDLRQKAPGRGVYVHAERDCLRLAARKGGFSRGFKRRVVVDADELTEDVRRGIRRRLDEGLRVALQSQHLFVGATAVAQAFKDEAVGLLLVAADAGESTRRKYASNADRKNTPVRDALTGEQLGAVCGRDFVAVMALAPSRPLASVRRDIDKLAHLEVL